MRERTTWAPPERGRPRILLVVGAVGLVLAAAAWLASGSAQAQAQAAPTNTAEPTISGNPTVGSTLTATQGSWSNDPTSFSYQWVRCPADGGPGDGSTCAAISGATTLAYVPGNGDVGSTLRIRVTATNADGSTTAASNHTAVVTASSKPTNTAEPTISGSPVQGQKLTATTGAWTGTAPIAFAYQWVRCPADGGAGDGSNCAPVSGATSSAYTLQPGDVGARMRVRVTATNSAGSQTAASNPTATVTASGASAPANTREPSIVGTPRQGSTLVASTGTWTGAQPISFSVQWLRCGADGGRPDGSDCAQVGTGSSYVPQAADVNGRLRVRVTATNGAGSRTAVSNPTAAVQGASAASGSVVSVTSVSLPQRLVIDRVQFVPNPVRSREADIVLRVHVSDTRGFGVSGALVFARSTPLVTTTPPEQATGADGWVTLTLAPRPDFPLRPRHNVQFFVRARKGGESVLAGVSTRRLVQVRTAR